MVVKKLNLVIFLWFVIFFFNFTFKDILISLFFFLLFFRDQIRQILTKMIEEIRQTMADLSTSNSWSIYSSSDLSDHQVPIWWQQGKDLISIYLGWVGGWAHYVLLRAVLAAVYKAIKKLDLSEPTISDVLNCVEGVRNYRLRIM